MRGTAALAAIGLVLALAAPTSAAVLNATSSGFELKQVVHIAAPPARVYAALIEPAKWWDSGHTYSHNAANLTLNAHAGGCFCEALPNGGVVQHLSVVLAAPGQSLELRGALGPFHARGVDGVLAFNIAPAGDGADLTMTNDLGGYMSEGMEQWAPRADAMLAGQIGRLKHYIETGSPQ